MNHLNQNFPKKRYYFFLIYLLRKFTNQYYQSIVFENFFLIIFRTDLERGSWINFFFFLEESRILQNQKPNMKMKRKRTYKSIMYT